MIAWMPSRSHARQKTPLRRAAGSGQPSQRGGARGFTSHVWPLESSESSWLAQLAYQPPGDVENGLRAAVVAKSGVNTGLPVLTRDGELTRLVEYPIRQFHALAVLRFVEGQPLDWTADG